MKNERYFLVEVATVLGSMEVNEVELHTAPSFRELDLEKIALDKLEGNTENFKFDELHQGWVDDNGVTVRYPSVVSELTKEEKLKWEEAQSFKKMNRPVLLENEGNFYYVDVRDEQGDVKRRVISESDEFIKNGFIAKEEVHLFGLTKEEAKNLLEDSKKISLGDKGDEVEIINVHKDYIEDSGLTEKFEHINYTDEIRSIPSRKTVAFQVDGKWTLNPHVDAMLLMDNDKLRLSEIIKENRSKDGNELVDDLNAALKSQLGKDTGIEVTYQDKASTR